MNLFDEMLEDKFQENATSLEKVFIFELRNITKQLKILNELKVIELSLIDTHPNTQLIEKFKDIQEELENGREENLQS